MPPHVQAIEGGSMNFVMGTDRKVKTPNFLASTENSPHLYA